MTALDTIRLALSQPAEDQALRERENVSQAVLAHQHNVTAALTDQWQRSETF